MYTKARIAGHPIHPMLVAFPVALYTLTVVSLLVYVGTHDYFWYRAATYANIGGVVMAAVAAVPGLIDFLSIPNRTRARETGLKHAGFNSLALVLFAISAIILGHNWFDRVMRDGRYALDTAAPLVLSLVGLVSTVAAGWLGWRMVQTHHVGVKPAHDGAAGLQHRDEIDDLDEIPMEHTDRHFPPRTVTHPGNRSLMRH